MPVIETTPEMVKKTYETMKKNLEVIRKRLNRPLTLAEKIVRHWTCGPGGEHNPKRREALSLIRTTASLGESREAIAAQYGAPPVLVGTCARRHPKAVGFASMAARLKTGTPHLLLFGTAWGLAPEVMETADIILEPIGDHQTYNHLSVRCAAAIVLDRLMTSRQ